MSYTGFWDEIRKIPPVTRFLCGSSLAVSVPVMLHLLDAYKVVFIRDQVIQQLELWRVWSSFFFGGLNYLFELVMLYRNSNALELDHYPRRSPDYAWQLTLAAGAILTLNLPLGSFVHARALTLCILYLSSALAPAGSQSSLMGLITVPVQYLPYAMIGLDMIMGGPRAAAVSVTGAVVGHLWWWMIYGEDGRGLPGVLEFGRAPSWVRALVSEGAGPNVAGTGVHAIPPRQQREPGRASGYNWGGGG
ncbi:DER1-domain-containing protein [Russula earlei]|uniref:DER1-domain-containing protein n=1 Tax=Russula earlei TaxID=71964 RepID=A0ACC0U9T7_9AGAM|nr:DER1-domain-containing protein [Russula earlei]